MIVLLTENTNMNYVVMPGDTFNLEYHEPSGRTTTIVRENITNLTHIDYIASFVFCLENGVVASPNICGIFGNKNNIPKEIKTAKRINDLTEEQLMALIRTSPVEINKYN